MAGQITLYTAISLVFSVSTPVSFAETSEQTALIVIDVQNCFTGNGTLAVAGGDDVVPIINDLRTRLESLFDLVVISQDWHCVDHVSFASQHPGYDVYDTKDLYYNDNGDLCRTANVTNPYAKLCPGETHLLQQSLWPDHCVINTTDADFHQDLKILDSDVIIQKGNKCHLDSYSVFYDNGRFGETRLQQLLRDNDVTTVYITGLATDFCVYWTAKDSNELGFDTYVVVDTTRGVAPDTTRAALEDMNSLGIHLVNSTDLPVTSSAASVSFGASLVMIGMLPWI